MGSSLCRPVRARLQSSALYHARETSTGSLGPSANSHQVWHREGKRAGQAGRSAIEDHTSYVHPRCISLLRHPGLMPEWRAWSGPAAFLGRLAAPKFREPFWRTR